jgi:hypothetical protein
LSVIRRSIPEFLGTGLRSAVAASGWWLVPPFWAHLKFALETFRVSEAPDHEGANPQAEAVPL